MGQWCSIAMTFIMANKDSYFITPADNLAMKYGNYLPQAEADPNGKDLNSPGAKADAGKLRTWLVLSRFHKALNEVAAIGTFGANKYTPDGWKSVPGGHQRYMDAALRHLMDYASGQRLDDGPGGSGRHHLGAVIWNLMAAMELEDEHSA